MNDIVGFLEAALAASLLAKGAVEGVKIAVDLPRWAPILLAFLFAPAFEGLLLVAKKTTFTSDVLANAAIVAFVAWMMAIGVTALQNKGEKVNARIDAALALPKGSSTDDVDAAVKRKESK